MSPKKEPSKIAQAAVGLLIVIVIVAIATSSGDDEEVLPDGVTLSERQVSLETSRKEFFDNYRRAGNDIKSANIFAEAGNWTREFAQSYNYKFENWYGIVTNLFTSDGGNEAHLVIKSEYHDILVEYKQSGILKDSDVYTDISSLNVGSGVYFSGFFKPADGSSLFEGKGVAELSLTNRGSLEAPEFSVIFLAVGSSKLPPLGEVDIETAMAQLSTGASKYNEFFEDLQQSVYDTNILLGGDPDAPFTERERDADLELEEMTDSRLSLALTWREMPRVRENLKHCAIAIAKIAAQKLSETGKDMEWFTISVRSQQREKGVTGKKLIRTFGRARYTGMRDIVEWIPPEEHR